jgi:signal transduction histidine kinase
MRNRLTPAKTGAELLEDMANPTPAKTKTATQHILKSLESSLKLVDALDELWQIMPSEPQPISFPALLKEISANLGLTLVTEGTEETLELDVALWTAVLGQVLENVKQHGGEKAHIRWTLADDRLKVSIADKGPGLGAMLTSRALEATRRSESSTGTGMGLSKAAFAALLLGGTLKLETSPGGVTVEVEATLQSGYAPGLTQPR